MQWRTIRLQCTSMLANNVLPTYAHCPVCHESFLNAIVFSVSSESTHAISVSGPLNGFLPFTQEDTLLQSQWERPANGDGWVTEGQNKQLTGASLHTLEATDIGSL